MIEVKTKPDVFQLVWRLKKFSELRFDDDKNYMIGETLLQREYHPCKKRYSGRWAKAKISAMTRLSHWIPGVDFRWVIVHLDPETLERGK